VAHMYNLPLPEVWARPADTVQIVAFSKQVGDQFDSTTIVAEEWIEA
jgi:hypothetical protein